KHPPAKVAVASWGRDAALVFATASANGAASAASSKPMQKIMWRIRCLTRLCDHMVAACRARHSRVRHSDTIPPSDFEQCVGPACRLWDRKGHIVDRRAAGG